MATNGFIYAEPMVCIWCPFGLFLEMLLDKRIQPMVKGCGDMKADIIPWTGYIEYREIAEQVSEKVSFGACGWCI